MFSDRTWNQAKVEKKMIHSHVSCQCEKYSVTNNATNFSTFTLFKSDMNSLCLHCVTNVHLNRNFLNGT